MNETVEEVKPVETKEQLKQKTHDAIRAWVKALLAEQGTLEVEAEKEAEVAASIETRMIERIAGMIADEIKGEVAQAAARLGLSFQR